MKLYNYKDNKIGKPEYKKATAEEVLAELTKIAEQHKTSVEKDGASEIGDIVTIDFEGFLDGVPFEGGKGENYDLKLGSATFIPGFEDQLVGYTKDAKVDVNVTFPENYQAENLAGKPVVFKCKIHAIKNEVTPELNDEFAKQFNLESLEAMKQELEKQMNYKREGDSLNAYLDALCKFLVEKSEIDVEDELVDTQLGIMVNYYDRQMAQYGTNLEGYLQMTGMTLDMFKEQLRPQAVMVCKQDVLYAEIASAEKLDVTSEEIEQEIAMYKQYYKLSEEQENRITDLTKELLRRKVSKMLVESNN